MSALAKGINDAAGVLIDTANQFRLIPLSMRTGVSTQILAEFYRLWALDRQYWYVGDDDSGSLYWDISTFQTWMQDFKPQDSRARDAWYWFKYNIKLIFFVSVFWLVVFIGIIWGI